MKIKWTLNRQIILGCIIFLMLPILLVGFRMYTSSNEFIGEQLESMNFKRIQDYNEYYLDEINSNLLLFLDIWNQDPRIQMMTTSKSLEEEIFNEWQLTIKGYPEVLSIYYSDTNKTFINYPDFSLDDDYDPTKRVWYLEAIKSHNDVVWTEPYIDAMTEEIIVTIAKAQKDASGDIQGVLAIDVTLKELSSFTNNSNISDNGYLLILSQNGQIIASPNKEDYGVDAYTLDWGEEVLLTEDGSFYLEVNEIPFTVSHTVNQISGWTLVGFVPDKDYQDVITPLVDLFRDRLLIIIAWGAISISLLLFYAHKIFVKPIDQLKNYMQLAGNGDLRIQVEETKRTDEVGELYTSFNQMIKGQKKLIGKVLDMAQHLQSSVEESRTVVMHSKENNVQQVKSMSELFDNLDLMNTSIQTISSNTNNISHNLEDLSISMQDMGYASNEVAESTVKTAESISDVSSALRTLDDSITSIHNDVVETTEEGLKVTEAVSTGRETLHETKSSISKSKDNMETLLDNIHILGSSAKKISDIIEFIDDITEQTTLLALNASIEAARAGDHGKGFAVVANAISRLAEKAKHSTRDVDHIISTIQHQVKNSIAETERSAADLLINVSSVEALEEAFVRIDESITSALKRVESIKDNASDELSYSKTIMSATENVGDLTMEVSAATEEQVATFTEMISKVETMNRLGQDVYENTVKQAVNSENITEAGRTLNKMTTDLASLSDTIENISQAIETQSEELVKLVTEFKL
jgi:methyl-accepting chemotaxis protein